MVGDKGTVLRTADGGETWTKIKTEIKENLYAVSFSDDNNGFIVGAGGLILRTVDGGMTWADQESPLRNNLFAVTATGQNSAIATGDFGTILITEDGGKTWAMQPAGTSKLLQAVASRGGSKVWVTGRGGTILRRTEPFSKQLISWPKSPPVLIKAGNKIKPQIRKPLVTIADDGDIPIAVPQKKP
ncbi:MAG: hypothetical protein IPK01_00910 [Acidobacteria bacterium]|nr:hypothetical protein [Acidobacteriota bacterium]